jgi:DNA repair protein RecO (recombination protein O)
MIEWRDEGIVLAARAHGETAAIADLFTAAHGRHHGVVRGGLGRRMRPVLQPGNLVSVTWRARLDEHIGAYNVELIRTSAPLMSDRAALAALSAVTALLAVTLPERDPHADLHRRTEALLVALDGDDWPAMYLRWELRLLEELGYGLDLTRCAVTGSVEGLAFVSPNSGRAVSQAAAAEWADRLLPLPGAMLMDGPAPPADVLAGLRTTGHFLARLAADLGDRPVPPARDRLIAELARRVA